MKKLFFTAVIVFFCSQIATAQNYQSDRPGIGNGSFITPKNMLGIEAGIQFTSTERTEQYDIGQVLLRYGLSHHVEVRALLGSYSRMETELMSESAYVDGFQDIGAGLKFRLISTQRGLNISGLTEVNLPVGSENFTNDDAVPSAGILTDYALSERISISSNVGYSFRTPNVEDRWLFTLTPGFTISNSVGGFLGYAGNYFDEFEQHWIEGGLTISIENGIQLDGNFGYDTESETFFLGIGFALGL